MALVLVIQFQLYILEGIIYLVIDAYSQMFV